MRTLLVFFAGCLAASAQIVSVGVKGGTPLTDFLDAARNNQVDYFTNTNRYIVGASFELHLPFGLGVEADGLYRHLNYASTSLGVDTSTQESTTASDVEFPLLVKYRFPTKGVRPFLDGGVAFDKLAGVKQFITNTVLPAVQNKTTTSNPAELHNSSTEGFVIGGGLDIKLLVIHILPEVRFTRWNAQHFFDVNGLLHTNVNQGEFLLGINF